MIRFRQLLRSLLRYRQYNIINMLGLALGIAAMLTLSIMYAYETGFDSFHRQGDNIHRVVLSDVRNKQAVVPYATAQLLRPQVSSLPATQIHNQRNLLVRHQKDAPILERNIVFADSLFFAVFDFQGIDALWKKGSPEGFSRNPMAAVLTESTAAKFFGTADPVGKILKLDNSTDVEVVGVISDLPGTTHLPFNMLVRFERLQSSMIGGLEILQWGIRTSGYCYVKLNAPADEAEVVRALASIVKAKSSNPDEAKEVFTLQPLADIHTNTVYESSNPAYTITPLYASLLLVLGVFILSIAAINYINLATSIAFSRAREMGVRKAIGGSRKQLLLQCLFETGFLIMLALIIGIIVTWVSLPAFNALLSKQMEMSTLLRPGALLLIAAGALILGVISGLYPAFILSGFRPIESLRNQLVMPGPSSVMLRKALVGFQFVISVVLIICTLVLARQSDYFMSKPLGFDEEGVAEIDLPISDSSKIELFRTGLSKINGVERVSFGLGAPITDNGFNTSLIFPGRPDETHELVLKLADTNYLKVYNIPLLAGRQVLPGEIAAPFQPTAVVVNEALTQLMGFKDPSAALGKRVLIGVNDIDAEIVGVVPSFHTSTLHEKILPTAIVPFPYFYYNASVKLNLAQLSGAMPKIAALWKQLYPDGIYSFRFMDETLATRYEAETRNLTLFRIFAALSIFISCLGLYGLISFTIIRKRKEVGVRQVLGASVAQILGLLSGEFFRLALLSLIIASPIAWFIMNKWLQQFAYRVAISWWIFPLSGAILIVIAFATISVQSFKAAMANPVKSLRTE